jgi:hypothetical protein
MMAKERAEIVAAGEVRLRVGWTQRLRARLGLLLRAAGLPGLRRSRPRLRVLEQVSLGGRRQLFLVACAGERYLVGAGSETVGSIVRLERLDQTDRMDQTDRLDRVGRTEPPEREGRPDWVRSAWNEGEESEASEERGRRLRPVVRA